MQIYKSIDANWHTHEVTIQSSLDGSSFCEFPECTSAFNGSLHIVINFVTLCNWEYHGRHIRQKAQLHEYHIIGCAIVTTSKPTKQTRRLLCSKKCFAWIFCRQLHHKRRQKSQRTYSSPLSPQTLISKKCEPIRVVIVLVERCICFSEFCDRFLRLRFAIRLRLQTIQIIFGIPKKKNFKKWINHCEEWMLVKENQEENITTRR